jgi:hypothetical protein
MPYTTVDSVRWYDASHLEEDSNIASGYFYPPLGEAIVADLVEFVPSAQHTEIDVAGHADHFRLPASTLSIMHDRVNTLLRREGRQLVS